MNEPKVSPYTGSASERRGEKSELKGSAKTPGSYQYGKTRGQASAESSKLKKTPRRKIAENEEEYEILLSLSGNSHGIRPKRLNISTLISTMEDLYTARFIKDTSYFKAQLKKGSGEEISDKPFPNFIYEFYR